MEWANEKGIFCEDSIGIQKRNKLVVQLDYKNRGYDHGYWYKREKTNNR